MAVLRRADAREWIAAFAPGIVGDVRKAPNLAGQPPFDGVEEARLAQPVGAGIQGHPWALRELERIGERSRLGEIERRHTATRSG